MSAISISHSSRDVARAERLAAWLREQSHRLLFLDFDPQCAIPPGRDWDRERHQQLRRCRALIALVRDHFVASEWCKGEVRIASNQGKSQFPVKVGASDLPQMLGRLQAIDLTTEPDSGLGALSRGLVVAGLVLGTSFSWDGRRLPNPGLMAFQEVDAAVRFGRDRQTWLVLDPIRPGVDPMDEAAPAPPPASQLDGLRRCSGQRQAAVVVEIAQFEELLSSTTAPAGAAEGVSAQHGQPALAEPFLAELRQGVGEGDGDGSLRRWRNGRPLGDRIETGRALVWLSADRVIAHACRHELPELTRAPERLSDMKASSLCRRTGALR